MNPKPGYVLILIFRFPGCAVRNPYRICNSCPHSLGERREAWSYLGNLFQSAQATWSSRAANSRENAAICGVCIRRSRLLDKRVNLRTGCGKTARPGLCGGGRPVTGVPTADFTNESGFKTALPACLVGLRQSLPGKIIAEPFSTLPHFPFRNRSSRPPDIPACLRLHRGRHSFCCGFGRGPRRRRH